MCAWGGGAEAGPQEAPHMALSALAGKGTEGRRNREAPQVRGPGGHRKTRGRVDAACLTLCPPGMASTLSFIY